MEASAGTLMMILNGLYLIKMTWDYLGSHPHDFSSDVPGCTDIEACNFNADATLMIIHVCIMIVQVIVVELLVEDACGECNGDGSSCAAANLFFSEAAEGSSNNKYLEIYNASDATVSFWLCISKFF